MKKFFQPVCFILSVTFLIFLTSPAFGLDPVYSNFFGQAIRGYDPVAYFKEGKPVEGKRAFQYDWKEATWYFASQENLDAFVQSPDHYAPQYGGYCAWAVSQGYTASIDPEAWHIHEGKLYLNYSKSVKRKWEKDIPGNIQKGNKNWPTLLADN